MYLKKKICKNSCFKYVYVLQSNFIRFFIVDISINTSQSTPYIPENNS